MIRRAQEMKIDQEQFLKGGKGTVQVVNFIEKSEAAGAGRLFGISTIQPGDSIGYHNHEGDFEAYYFLKGKALVNDNGEEVLLDAGDAMLCREGEGHAVTCVGEEELVYVSLILYPNEKNEDSNGK